MKLGLKIRYNEPIKLGDFNPQMLELHLADEDLTTHRNEIIDKFSVLTKIPVVIHTQQSLFLPMEKRPLVDLASQYEKLRNLSLDVVGRTIDLAGEIEADYVVVHPGGIVPEPQLRTEPFMENLLSSLRKLEEDHDTKELLMENMPWFYWMWNGGERWHSMILTGPEDFTPVLEYTNVVLDICHAYLAEKNGSNDNIFSFLGKHGREIKHVHLSDAAAPDKEGLQFGDGEIELRKVFRKILDTDVTAIPEIKRGHLDGMEGFGEAINRFSSILLGRDIPNLNSANSRDKPKNP